MNKRNMKAREYNCSCVTLLKNSLATYGLLVKLAIVKRPVLTFFHALFNFTLCCLALFLSVSETHTLWEIFIDFTKIDSMTAASGKD